jgi:hypothetical protein
LSCASDGRLALHEKGWALTALEQWRRSLGYPVGGLIVGISKLQTGELAMVWADDGSPIGSFRASAIGTVSAGQLDMAIGIITSIQRW